MARPLKVVAFTGPSGSGKTTAIEMLIRHHVAESRTVAAIKHTHHELNTDQRGDTLRFRGAGAEPVILAGDDHAIVFSSRGAEIIEFVSPADLPASCGTDVILIEGFKGEREWPVVELRAGRWLTLEELLKSSRA